MLQLIVNKQYAKYQAWLQFCNMLKGLMFGRWWPVFNKNKSIESLSAIEQWTKIGCCFSPKWQHEMYAMSTPMSKYKINRKCKIMGNLYTGMYKYKCITGHNIQQYWMNHSSKLLHSYIGWISILSRKLLTLFALKIVHGNLQNAVSEVFINLMYFQA